MLHEGPPTYVSDQSGGAHVEHRAIMELQVLRERHCENHDASSGSPESRFGDSGGSKHQFHSFLACGLPRPCARTLAVGRVGPVGPVDSLGPVEAAGAVQAVGARRRPQEAVGP